MRQDQTQCSMANGRPSPSHAAPRDLNAMAEGLTCKAVCQMSLHMSVHSTTILLLSRDDENYPNSGFWDHVSTETKRFVFSKTFS